MPVDCFLDTNILVYAAAGRKTEEEKWRLALELIDSTDFGLSAQVLQEFYVTVTRKVKSPLAAAEPSRRARARARAAAAADRRGSVWPAPPSLAAGAAPVVVGSCGTIASSSFDRITDRPRS